MINRLLFKTCNVILNFFIHLRVKYKILWIVWCEAFEQLYYVKHFKYVVNDVTFSAAYIFDISGYIFYNYIYIFLHD